LATRDKVREIRLTWDKSPDREVAGYRIYRSQYPDRDYRPIGIVKSRNTTRYLDKGDAKNPLGDAVQYFYRITAYYPSKKESQKSEAASATTTGKPSIPKGLMAESALIREIPLSWTPNPEPEVKGYNIYRSGSKDGPYSLIIKVDGGKKKSYVDSKELADKTEYFYRITAFNTAGVESDPTVPVSATTRGIPLAPQGLMARRGMVKSVLLEWTPPPDPEVRGYIVYGSSSPEGEFIEVKGISGKQKNSFLDRGSSKKRLKDGTVYYYKIRSHNKVDVLSEETEIVSARTKRAPQAPMGLKALGGQARRISLRWNPNPEKDIKHYVLYRSDDPAKKYKKIAVEPEGKTEFTDTKLADGTTYHYKMNTIDKDGLESEFSETISATTKPAPSRPKGIKAEGGRGRVVISWDANPEADIIRYHVYRKAARFKKIGSTEGLSYTDEKVKNEKSYTYAVTAADRDGLESEFSTEVSATTAPE